MKQIGRPWPNGPELKILFEQAGFANVRMEEFKRPSNDWPKEPRFKEIGRVRPAFPAPLQTNLSRGI